MRVKDHMLLADCIKILFEFFQKNGIKSSTDQVYSDESLQKIILESKVTDFNYDPYTNVYTTGIRLKVAPKSSLVFFFLFGNNITSNNYVVVELEEEDYPSRIKISLECEKFLPFIPKFDPDIDPARIMSLDEFENFLETKKRPGRLKVIEVP